MVKIHGGPMGVRYFDDCAKKYLCSRVAIFPMSGEKRLKLVGFLALTLVCIVLVIASGASAEEGDDSTDLLDDLNENQNANGSWDEDVNITITAIVANTVVPCDDGIECSYSLVLDGMDWTVDNYHSDASIETQAHISMTKFDCGDSPDQNEIYLFRWEVTDELRVSQDQDGSWNRDVGDTALATLALAIEEGKDSEAVIKGIEWIKNREVDYSWGSVQYDAKAIMALDSAGEDVWQELAALMLKQKPDGSFGGIEDTSWAVIALSTNPNRETMDSMDKAVLWLRNQNYDDNHDLAIAALAEQKYESAKLEVGEKGESGFIPPPWMYTLSIFIICSFVIGFWLFARLDRNGTLDGIRKDIYAYVAEHPGEHLANITKTLDLSSSSARYHLSVLEGMDKVVSHKNGKYKRYYINKNGYSKYTNGNGYKGIMSALKNNTARKIVKFLISNPESNQKKVSNALKIHPSTVNWHAKRLKEAEIISKKRKGKEIVYSLNQDVQLRKVIGILEGSIA
jgi:predicted transcriptional regulator